MHVVTLSIQPRLKEHLLLLKTGMLSVAFSMKSVVHLLMPYPMNWKYNLNWSEVYLNQLEEETVILCVMMQWCKFMSGKHLLVLLQLSHRYTENSYTFFTVVCTLCGSDHDMVLNFIGYSCLLWCFRHQYYHVASKLS